MKLLFLSYINRSGSSFLAQKLSELENIFVFPEADVLIEKILLSNQKITNLKDNFKELCKIDSKLKSWQFSEKEIEHILLSNQNKIDFFLDILTTYKKRYDSNSILLIFKYQNTFSQYLTIKKILTNITIYQILILRDPRAIYFSQKTTINPYTKKNFTNNPLIVGFLWHKFSKYIENINHDSYFLSFENLMETEYTFITLLNFLQISNKKREKTTTYFDLLPEEQKNIHLNTIKEPQKENINKWQNYLKKYEISLIENICKIQMQKFKYNPITHKVNIIQWFIKYYFKIRIYFKIDNYY